MLTLRSFASRSVRAARRTVTSVCALDTDSAGAKPKASRPRAAAAKAASAPPKALRAPTAFNLYQKAATAEVKKQHPDAKLPELLKLVRAQWDALPADGKQPFESEAAEKKAVVDAERAKIQAERKANARPMTAFMLYSQKERATVKAANPDFKVTDIARKLGEAWKALSQEEKDVFVRQAADAASEWKAKHGKASAA